MLYVVWPLWQLPQLLRSKAVLLMLSERVHVAFCASCLDLAHSALLHFVDGVAAVCAS